MENNGEKIYTEGIKKPQGKFYRWFDNYWYHYKWHTVITAFFLTVFIICTLQMCTRQEDDMRVIYAGPAFIHSQDAESVCRVLETVIPEDFNADGEKKVGLSSYQIYSREQIEAIEAETDSEGAQRIVDREYISQNNTDFYNYVLTGEAYICFLDPHIYADLKANNRIASISETLGYDCDMSADGYGIVISDLAIYEEYSVLGVLPEDTVICCLEKVSIGKNSKVKVYEQHAQMFKALIEFKKES